MRVTRREEARMRGGEDPQAEVWSYIPLEQRVPAAHPLRPMRAMVDAVLAELSPQFSELYSRVGRPSIAPERLLRALLLQVLYSVRSERLLMEQLDYNLLFRWFVGLKADDPIWDATVFTKNRQRLLDGDIARAFFERVVAHARERGLLSDEHFTVDGTLIEAWASLKSFKRTDAPPPAPDDPGNPTVNFHGERRSNATHASTTDPEARLFRKGDSHEAKLYYHGHVVMENRHGLAVNGSLTPASGFAERDQGLLMAAQLPRRPPRPRRHPASGAEQHEAFECDRSPHHAARRLWGEPAPAQAHRRDLRVAEDGRLAAQDAPSWGGARRLDVRVRLGGV